MSEQAKILRFPSRQVEENLSADAALDTARQYLSTSDESRSPTFKEASLSNCDTLLAICKLLRESIEGSPTTSFAEAASLYSWIASSASFAGLFDEREYVLGEVSLIAAKASRLLGKLREAEKWLDRSEAAFRHTVNPAPSLSGIGFERLALRFASGLFEETLELLPSLKASFRKLGMGLEHAKAQFLEAVTLRATGREEEHFCLMQRLEQETEVRGCPSLHGQVLVHIGNYEASLGQFEAAARTYESALPVVLRGDRPVALCELKWSIGNAYREQGNLWKAVESYRSTKNDYARLGFQSFVTQLSLVIAETLLALGRDREAEWEILAALPMIEEERMGPEGLAAVALLRESVRRRKTNHEALRELRTSLLART